MHIKHSYLSSLKTNFIFAIYLTNRLLHLVGLLGMGIQLPCHITIKGYWVGLLANDYDRGLESVRDN
jgi:hypothetical protein